MVFITILEKYTAEELFIEKSFCIFGWELNIITAKTFLKKENILTANAYIPTL